MDIAPIDAAHELLKSAIGRPIRPSTGELNVEMLATNPLLPTSRKWAIRFNASGTVTIVLGMRDYGWGWYSAHFASLAAARLGLPFRWMRVYYSATLPAVLQTPQESRIQPDGCRSGPLAVAVGELIEEMCGRVIENGRAIFAKMAGATTASIRFDQTAGRFLVLDGNRSASILDIAAAAREKMPPAA
jgi:aerobic carbon-monoxide dehydrogenase large subunit